MFRDARMPSTHTPEHTHTLVRFIQFICGCGVSNRMGATPSPWKKEINNKERCKKNSSSCTKLAPGKGCLKNFRVVSILSFF